VAEGNDQETIAAMMKAAMFSALGEGEVRDLAGRCAARAYRAGEIIFVSGREADRFFVILSGKVKVFKLSARGDEQILHLYGPGDTFGEAAMWAGIGYPANAAAVTDAKLLAVTRSVLRDAVSRSGDLAFGMLAGMSAKLHEFTRLIEQLSLKAVPARLAEVLLEMSDVAGAATFRLGGTKRQLAARIGTAPETLSRALAKLTAAGCIEVHGSQIRILDRDALARLSQAG